MSEARRGLPARPRWVGIAFVAVVLLAALLVARSCQAQDVRIKEEQAVATARAQIDFAPERTSIRFVRQGVKSHPYYAVSFSAGRDGTPARRLTTVLVDARNGTVAQINREQ